MHNSGHHCVSHNYLLKNQKSAGLGRSLSNTGMGCEPPLPAAPSPSQCFPSPLHPPVQGSYKRGSLATSLKDRKWLMIPPPTPQGWGEWVVKEDWEREFQIRKVAQTGRVTRAGISEMTMTSALVTLPHFPRQASQSTAVHCFPSSFTETRR